MHQWWWGAIRLTEKSSHLSGWMMSGPKILIIKPESWGSTTKSIYNLTMAIRKTQSIMKKASHQKRYVLHLKGLTGNIKIMGNPYAGPCASWYQTNCQYTIISYLLFQHSSILNELVKSITIHFVEDRIEHRIKSLKRELFLIL